MFTVLFYVLTFKTKDIKRNKGGGKGEPRFPLVKQSSMESG